MKREKQMPKVLKTNVTKIDFGIQKRNIASDIVEFEVSNDSYNTLFINQINFPENVFGRLKGTSSFSSNIIETFEIPMNFIPGNKYFMDLDGKITEDERITGIFLGTGASDKNLEVDVQIGLQDELGWILEDEQGQFLEDV